MPRNKVIGLKQKQNIAKQKKHTHTNTHTKEGGHKVFVHQTEEKQTKRLQTRWSINQYIVYNVFIQDN